MKAEAEILPVDTDDIDTAEVIKVIITTETDKRKKAFIGYLKLGARVNRIK